VLTMMVVDEDKYRKDRKTLKSAYRSSIFVFTPGTCVSEGDSERRSPKQSDERMARKDASKRKKKKKKKKKEKKKKKRLWNRGQKRPESES
jgi:hypothetical protein